TDVDAAANKYFNGTIFTTGGPYYLSAQGTPGSWTYNNANLSFLNDHRYNVTAAATDFALNVSSSTSQFVYDVQAPTSSVVSPAPGYVTSWTLITGSATDHVSGVPATGVQVAVKSLFGAGGWWNGTNFTGSDPDWGYFTVTNTSTTAPNTWTTTLPTGAGSFTSALVSGTSYYIVSLSTDAAGNSEFGALAADIPAGVGVTITYDIVAPTATITLPNYPALPGAKAIEGLSTISGTAAGDTGVSSVQVAILKNGASPLWFDGTGFFKNQAQPYFLSAGGGSSWSYSSGNLTFSDHTVYTIVARAAAPSGQTQSVYAAPGSSVTVTVDKTAPTTSVSAPPAQGASYKPADIGQGGSLLAGTAADAGPSASGPKDVQIRLSYLSGGASYYWTGSQFSSSTVNASTAWQSITTGAPEWSYPIPITWPSDESHAMTLESRAEDNTVLADGTG